MTFSAQPAPSRALLGDTITLVVFLLIAATLPSGVFFLASTSSQAPGLLVAALTLILLVVVGIGRSPPEGTTANGLILAGAVIVLILVHQVVAAVFVTTDLDYVVSSAALLGVVVFAGVFLRETFFRSPDGPTARAATIVLALGSAAIIAGAAGIQPQAYGFERPIFPFTEPSHYALVISPFLIWGCVMMKGWRRVGLLVFFLFMAYLMKSLSLVVAIVLASAISLPILRLLPVVAVVSVFGFFLDLSYFTERLSFDPTTNNISQLVYLQGSELISDAIARTLGWGFGFQNLGFAPITSPTSDQIFRLVGSDINLKDGGFTAAKIVSEFGVIGIALLAWITFQAIRASVRLRAVATERVTAPAGVVLAWAFLAGSMIEMYIRGIGYFSPTTLFFVAAVGINLDNNTSENIRRSMDGSHELPELVAA